MVVNINVFPLFLWHVSDAREPGIKKQEQFSRLGRSVDLRQEKSKPITVLLELPAGILPIRPCRQSSQQENDSAQTSKNSTKPGSSHTPSLPAVSRIGTSPRKISHLRSRYWPRRESAARKGALET